MLFLCHLHSALHSWNSGWNRQSKETVKPWSSPCGTSPGRRFWPARRCTLSPCKPAPGWQVKPGYCRPRSSSDGKSARSPVSCPRTLEEQLMSQLVHPQQTELQISVWTCLPAQIQLLANKETCADLCKIQILRFVYSVLFHSIRKLIVWYCLIMFFLQRFIGLQLRRLID